MCRYIVLNPVRVGCGATPDEWIWSSYYATATGKNVPYWLTVDWVLAQFAKKRSEARRKYREFVLDALPAEESPLKQAVGQLILGGKSFIEGLSPYLLDKSEIKEVTRQQRLAGRPSLGELFLENQDKMLRDQTVKSANLDYGYTLKEIADHVGRHYSTISRIVSN